jgi:hypothetical protein
MTGAILGEEFPWTSDQPSEVLTTLGRLGEGGTFPEVVVIPGLKREDLTVLRRFGDVRIFPEVAVNLVLVRGRRGDAKTDRVAES